MRITVKTLDRKFPPVNKSSNPITRFRSEVGFKAHTSFVRGRKLKDRRLLMRRLAVRSMQKQSHTIRIATRFFNHVLICSCSNSMKHNRDACQAS